MEQTRIAGHAIIARHGAAVQALWIAGFGLATAAGARVEIPHSPVPFTLQTLFVLLSGALLGKRNGFLSQMLYLCAGLSGLPVFAGGGFGPAHLLGPGGGYLMAFPVAAFVVGLLLERSRRWVPVTISMTAGLLVIFSLGTLWLYAAILHDWRAALTGGFLIFSWWDILKLAAAASIAVRLAGRKKEGA